MHSLQVKHINCPIFKANNPNKGNQKIWSMEFRKPEPISSDTELIPRLHKMLEIWFHGGYLLITLT